MKVLIIVLLVLLQGCSTLNGFKEPTLPPNTTVNINKELLKPCPLLKEDLVIMSFEDSLVVYSDLATSYAICANKQSISIKLIKKLGNIE